MDRDRLHRKMNREMQLAMQVEEHVFFGSRHEPCTVCQCVEKFNERSSFDCCESVDLFVIMGISASDES